MTKAQLKRIILTNIPTYDVTDENCENLYYKAKSNGIGRIIVGPASLDAIKGFEGRGLKVGVSIAYPSGAVTPELKVAEMNDCEAESSMIDMFFVTCSQGFYVSGHNDNLVKEMTDCVKATEKPVYFIIELMELTDAKLEFLVETAKKAGVKGLLLSTAFRPYDVIKDPDSKRIRKIKKLAGNDLEIIAAGRDMKTEEAALAAMRAGASSVLINVNDKVFGV